VLALNGRFGTRGQRVVGLSSYDPDDAAEETKATLEAAREEKMDYPTFLDKDGEYAKANGLGDIPAFVLLGPDGRVLHRHRGKLTEGTPAFTEMERAIEQALSSVRR
jgi:hypothetical protein